MVGAGRRCPTCLGTYVPIIAKRKQQEQARALRAKGLSLRKIAAELGVSLASASTWTRGIEPQIKATSVPVSPLALPAVVPVKHCGGCRRMLPAASFHRRQTRCKQCRREYMRRRGDLHRRQTYAARDRRRAMARRYALGLLSDGICADCGLADLLVLEFDHVGPKTAEISSLIREGYRLERIIEEMRQCELVCANCHRRRTALRTRSWRVDPEWRATESSRPLRRRNMLFLNALLRSVRCQDCGEADPVVLDFDHVGAKRGGVGQLAWREHSIASLEREIAQCEIRCANCHRRRTSEQQGHFRHHVLLPP